MKIRVTLSSPVIPQQAFYPPNESQYHVRSEKKVVEPSVSRLRRVGVAELDNTCAGVKGKRKEGKKLTGNDTRDFWEGKRNDKEKMN